MEALRSVALQYWLIGAAAAMSLLVPGADGCLASARAPCCRLLEAGLLQLPSLPSALKAVSIEAWQSAFAMLASPAPDPRQPRAASGGTADALGSCAATSGFGLLITGGSHAGFEQLVP